MSGYTVRFGVSAIDEICDKPTEYSRGDIVNAIHDAEVHYKNGNASKAWYAYVVQKLSDYR